MYALCLSISVAAKLNQPRLVPGVPDDPSAGVCAGFLDMTYGEMKEVFRPVIAEVLQLVKKQISEASKNGPISAVILVGGFGESVYLHRRIKEAVKPIPVLQPPNASVTLPPSHIHTISLIATSADGLLLFGVPS